MLEAPLSFLNRNLRLTKTDTLHALAKLIYFQFNVESPYHKVQTIRRWAHKYGVSSFIFHHFSADVNLAPFFPFFFLFSGNLFIHAILVCKRANDFQREIYSVHEFLRVCDDQFYSVVGFVCCCPKITSINQIALICGHHRSGSQPCDHVNNEADKLKSRIGQATDENQSI